MAMAFYQHKKYGVSNKAKKTQAQNKRNNHAASKTTAKIASKGYC